MKEIVIEGQTYRFEPLTEAETNDILRKKRLTLFTIRCLDFLFSLLGLIVLAIPLLIIAIWIKCDDPKGPVFFRQVRIGKNGKPFRIFKFRSMKVATEGQSQLTLATDNRITKVGKFIRKTKIDELPQLINVVIGQMSLVGPRPEVEKYVKQYDQQQQQILKIRPGITDEASIQFIDETKLFENAVDADALYVEKVMPVKIGINTEYIRHMSVIKYFKVIFKTIFSI